jgi:hypothetical protein
MCELARLHRAGDPGCPRYIAPEEELSRRSKSISRFQFRRQRPHKSWMMRRPNASVRNTMRSLAVLCVLSLDARICSSLSSLLFVHRYQPAATAFPPPPAPNCCGCSSTIFRLSTSSTTLRFSLFPPTTFSISPRFLPSSSTLPV